MNTRQFLLNKQSKRLERSSRKSAGFTLIELLVAIILAALVITPLLGFMINILSTDRKEQAKATSEQEIQAAADYINRDLQQAIYIYDQQALNNTHNEEKPENSGIKNQLPFYNEDNKIPVLVFWKRKLVKDGLPIKNGANCPKDENECDDTFVYSLVAYYLINDSDADSTWSQAYRIGRFEVDGGVKNPFDSDEYVKDQEPDGGYAPPLGQFSGSLRSQMNRWKRDGNYDGKLNVLVDYIDHTTESEVEDKEDIIPETYGSSDQYCPPDSDTSDLDPEWTQVPDYEAVDNEFKTFSFYACVNSAANTAKVFLRGNASARLRADREDSQYNEASSSYFPTAKIEVKGVGRLSGG